MVQWCLSIAWGPAKEDQKLPIRQVQELLLLLLLLNFWEAGPPGVAALEQCSANSLQAVWEQQRAWTRSNRTASSSTLTDLLLSCFLRISAGQYI
jgi:hypothetical protein